MAKGIMAIGAMRDGRIDWDVVIDPERWEPWGRRESWNRWIREPDTRRWLTAQMHGDPVAAWSYIEWVGPATAAAIHRAAWRAAWSRIDG